MDKFIALHITSHSHNDDTSYDIFYRVARNERVKSYRHSIGARTTGYDDGYDNTP